MAKTLPERFIQESVAARINDRYYRRRPVYVSMEVYTRLKRADVLLAFMRARGRPYVVVVEAKSRTTIHQLRLKHDRRRARLFGRLTAVVLIVSLSALLGYQWYFNAWNTLLLLGLFVLASVGITALIRRLELSLASSVGAIEQLGRYPANESWVAVGEDTFSKPTDAAELREQCRKNGVGLIEVDARGRLSFRVVPRPRHTFNNYLNRYGRGDEILRQIDRKPRYGPTPPERRQNRRRIASILLLLGLTGLLMLIGYERSYGPVVPDPLADARFRSPDSLRIGRLASESPTQEVSVPPRVDTAGNEDGADCPSVGRNELVYVVVDTIAAVEVVARRRARLRAAGLRGHARIAVTCLQDANGRTDAAALYTGARYVSPSEARHAVADYRRLLEQLGLEAPHARAVRVLPKDVGAAPL